MRRLRPTLLLALLTAVASWAWAQAPSPPNPATGTATGDGRVALVLGGGAARGAAHVGVIRALIEVGVPIDLILGTSMGSLIGGLYAAGFDVDTLADVVIEVDPTSVAELLLPPRGGALDLQPLSILLDALLEGRRLHEVAIPFYPVVIDLLTGEPQAAPETSLADAIRASTAIPVLFDPVLIGDRYYYDGGLKQTIPTSLARSLGASYIIAVDVTREIPYQPDSVQANLSRIFIGIVESFNVAELADTDVILDPGLRDHTYMDFGLAADFVAAGERVTRAELPRILADLDALGIALRPLGDPNAGRPINDGWRERLSVARREVALRPRPWNIAIDGALAPAASGERVTPAPAPVASRLRFGVDLRDGPLGRGYLGASYARSTVGGSDAVQLRAGYRLTYAWSVFALADLEFDGPWVARWGVRWLALPALTLEAALRQPLLAFDAAAHWRGDGLWLDVEGALALDGSWSRGHLEARTAIGLADPRWDAWTLRARVLAGTTSADAPTTERFSVGPATGLRGTPPDAWLATSLTTGTVEVAVRLGGDRDALEVALIAPSAWAFVDGARFDVGGGPATAWAIGVGAGIDGSLFGFVPFAFGADLGYGITTGTWRLGWRVGPRYPEPLRF